MRSGGILATLLIACASATSASQSALRDAASNLTYNVPVSPALFVQLEELSRIVDISYCVGLAGTGIQKPFSCLSRCRDFEHFELVKAWNTGPLLSDSCGYIAVSHAPAPERIILAFRGTYSISNTLADLSTIPQEYVPYPGDDDEHPERGGDEDVPRCANCTVHMGFFTSWLNTRREILPDVRDTIARYPSHSLTLVGHSLGGAVAAIAALDFLARGWDPSVTTFGQPRIGNAALNRYLDARFDLDGPPPPPPPHGDRDDTAQRFRRVTHAADPVPLLPLEEWGYAMHAGEIFIAKDALPPENDDVLHCRGPADPSCIAGQTAPGYPRALEPDLVHEEELDAVAAAAGTAADDDDDDDDDDGGGMKLTPQEAPIRELRRRWGLPARYRLWQLFFAHRDYFWRIGLCLPDLGGWHAPPEHGVVPEVNGGGVVP